MQKLDRLGWAAGLSVQAYGRLVGIRLTDAAVLDRLPEVVPHGAELVDQLEVDQLYSVVVGDLEPRHGRRRLHVVYADAMRVARTADFEVALAGLRRDLTLWVGENSADRVFLHAGVVALNGRAILLPGRTMSGKSTLVKALLEAGCSYLSDEFALLDPEGRVHPYARPMQIRASGDYSSEHVHPAELGAPVATGPLPVALVVLTRYRQGARWAARRQEPGRALLGMLEHALAARSYPELVVPALQRVAQQALVIKTVRAEANDTAARILRLLDEVPIPSR